MYKSIRCLFMLLTAALLLCSVGCGVDEPSESTADTQGNVVQLPDGMEAELGVADRDDETIAGTDDNADPSQTGSQESTVPQDNVSPETPSVSETKPQEKPNETPDVQETKPENTESTENVQTPDAPAPGSLTYQEFYALTPDQQEAYTDSFESLRAFNEWFNEAKAEYESTIPDETVSGSIDIGNLNP